MKRRTFLKQSAALGLTAALGNAVSAQPKPRDPIKDVDRMEGTGLRMNVSMSSILIERY